MLIKELYCYYKTNKIVICVLIFQITILFILLGTFFAFSGEILYGKGNLERIYQNKAIYQLLDGYFDADEFEKFREQEDALTILKKYYGGLNNAKSFQYLAMFNQGILVHDVENMFFDIEPLEDGKTKRMKSFQINKQANDYFALSVSEGRIFSAEDFKDKKVMPVVVGNNYKDDVAVGDKIKAVYYQKEIMLEVVGILLPNTYLYFNGDAEFYLDSHIILPYIDYTALDSDFDEWFQEIVYFAMINGYISIPDGSEFSTQMMLELETIAQQSGFYNYLFLGTNPKTQTYKGLINVVNANYAIVQFLFTSSFILNIVLISFQLYLIQKRRLPSLAIHYLSGASLTYLTKQFIVEVSTIILLAFTISQVILTFILKIATTGSIIILSMLAIAFIVSISIFPIYKLKKTELFSLLNGQEERL